MSRKEEFTVLLSPYLKEVLNDLRDKYGEDSKEFKSVAKQYYYSEFEDTQYAEVNSKHYEADDGDVLPHNLERLYRNHCCTEITYACAAHCRYCLRSNYDANSLPESDMIAIAKYMQSENCSEILITGGDPFCSPKVLDKFTDVLIRYAPSIKIFRIATRSFTQNPKLVSNKIGDIIKKCQSCGIIVEVATQINSPYEITNGTIKAMEYIRSFGVSIYSQNVFLKGVNDDPELLAELYNRIRLAGAHPHYLFHACPIKGTHHFRTSVKKMIETYESAFNSGQCTGRAKPMLAIMSAIGKVILTPLNTEFIKGDDGNNYVRLHSKYKYGDRIKYNPSWKIPDHAFVDDNGYLCIDYLDGTDD